MLFAFIIDPPGEFTLQPLGVVAVLQHQQNHLDQQQ